MVAVSGFFNEQYLRTDVKYCQYDPSLEGQDVEGCITRGILPWGWFNNCFKNTTAEPYTSQDQMFSCRLCQDTSTCVDSEPNDAYIENSTRTTVAALSYVVYCLSSVRPCTAPSARRAMGGVRQVHNSSLSPTPRTPGRHSASSLPSSRPG